MHIFIYKAFWPELFLSLSLILLLLFNSRIIHSGYYNFPILNKEIFIQIFIILFFLILLIFHNNIFGSDFANFFNSNLSTKQLKLFFIFICLLIFLPVWKAYVIQKLNFFEYFIIFLITLLALLFLINSFNLISLYLCLELQALGFFILASFNRTNLLSSEAGLKYFVSSSIVSAILLLGIAICYGLLGSFNFQQIYILISLLSSFLFNQNLFFILLFLGFCCIFFALLFKLVIAPFHFWFPQIYDGSPLSSTIIFTVIPKLALFNILIKIWAIFSQLCLNFDFLLIIIGLYSMLFGILKMLQQKRLKKLYIYSGISQLGLPLCVLSDNSFLAFGSIFFFICLYLLVNILIWSTFVIFSFNQNELQRKNNVPIYFSFFINLYLSNKFYAICFLFIFFSLAAIPPLSSFLGKVVLFNLLILNNQIELATIFIYFGTLGIYYYLKILKIFFFENIKKDRNLKNLTIFKFNFLSLESFIIVLLLFLLLFLGLSPNLLFFQCLLFSCF